MNQIINKKILKIGYFNSNSNQEWAVFPLKGAIEEAQKLQINLISFCGQLIKSEVGHQAQENIIYELAMNGALDGAIVWKGNFTVMMNDEEINDFCRRLKVPVVIVEGSLPGFTGVTYDNYGTMKIAINHLIDVHGIQKIGYLGQSGNHYAFGERFRAYQDILAERSIPYDESLVRPWNHWNSMNDDGKTNKALDAWLLEAYASGMRGLIGSSDPTAAWVLDRLEIIGIKVHQDIAVVGFDGLMQGKTAVPKLTSIRPAWEQLGELAVETIVKMVQGDQVPPINYISSQFFVSQSCGCIDINVTDTAQTDTINHSTNAWTAQSIDILEKSLKAEITGTAGNPFIQTLFKVLNDMRRADKKTILCQEVLTIVRNRLIPSCKGQAERDTLEILCQQARVAIGNAIEMQKDRILFDFNDWILFENELFRNLASTFDVVKIVEILYKTLPRLGIRECYMSMYENPMPYQYPQPVPEWSRLAMAFGGQNAIRFGHEGLRFRTGEIIPKELGLKEEARTLLVLPLNFEKKQIGFIVFRIEVELLNGMTINLLANQISAGIRGALLINELIDKDTKLEHAMKELKVQHDELEAATKLLTENQRRLVSSEKMASLGRLTAGIAHELNTPLAAVRTSVEILRDLVNEYSASIDDPNVKSEDHKAIAADMSKLVSSALASAEKSAGFIRGIKSQTSNLVTRPAARFAAAPVIFDALSLLDFSLKRSGCEIKAAIDETIELYGDPHELSQIVTNLVNNAVEACTQNKGQIIVSLKPQGENSSILKIEDNGSGISGENLSKVFDPMFTTKPFGVGTGLGLSIVHELVEKFKGHIEVESSPGKTIFSLIFPGIK